MKEIHRIQRLSDAFGPSGFEDGVIDIACQEAKELGLEHSVDSMRNLMMERCQEREGVHIHLDAHADEVGFIIQAIKPNGLLRFLPLGGWDAKNIASQKICLKNKKGELISGIVCSKPPHFMKSGEKKAELTFDDLLIDIGAGSAEEVRSSYHIGIGTPVVPAVECSFDEAHGIFLGKAFDCRIGCAALLQVLEELKDQTIGKHISATLSTQEEVGERGMKCIRKQLHSDVMICFEGCPADDTFEEEYMIQSGMKKGVMLRHFDVSMITNPRFMRFAIEIAEKYGIKIQESVRKGGGTNGGISHTENIPTIVLGIPVRYAHASYGYTAYEDYRQAVELALAIIHDLNEAEAAAF